MNELDVSELLTVQQAIGVIDAVEVRPRVVRVPLGESAGLRLAERILADRDFPPFNKSLMDGYAVRVADMGQPPVELRVVGEIAAGKWPGRGIGAGEAMAIMTGAPMPSGADGVVPVEDVEQRVSVGENVRVLRAPTPARLIALRGSDCPAGKVVLEQGAMMGAAQIAVAASVGAAEVDVYARPRVAVLGTGDELVAVTDSPGAAQIRNSNSPMLVALLRGLGCEVTDLGAVRDEPGLIRERLVRGLEFDALFVTGGMSMGTFDHVPGLLLEMGVTLKITKLRMKPGKPFVFAEAASSFIFGLPGNPVAAFVCTMRLAARLLARMAGGEPTERWVIGRLEEGLPANGPREFYQPALRMVARGRHSMQSEFAVVRPLAWKGSADLFTLAAANVLLVRAAGEPAVGKGAVVRVLEI